MFTLNVKLQRLRSYPTYLYPYYYLLTPCTLAANDGHIWLLTKLIDNLRKGSSRIVPLGEIIPLPLLAPATILIVVVHIIMEQIAVLWSKTTLITSSVGRTWVDPPPRKTNTFLLHCKKFLNC